MHGIGLKGREEGRKGGRGRGLEWDGIGWGMG